MTIRAIGSQYRFMSSRWSQLGRKSLCLPRRQWLSSSSKSVPAQPVDATRFSLLAWYSSKLDSHPLLTKGVTSGLVSGAGDFICQWVMHKDGDETWWDRRRTGRFTLLGAVLVAPLVHHWYGGLARWIPGTRTLDVVKRVVLDQGFFSPIFLPMWLTSMWTLEELPGFGIDSENHVPDERSYLERVIEAEPELLVANWILWIPAMAINFKFIPVKFQVLYSNVVALLWNVYLSFSTHNHHSDALEPAAST